MRPLIDGGTPPMKEEDHQRQQAFICDINRNQTITIHDHISNGQI